MEWIPYHSIQFLIIRIPAKNVGPFHVLHTAHSIMLIMEWSGMEWSPFHSLHSIPCFT